MATQIVRDGKLWLDGYDLSGDMSAMALTYGAEAQDDTALGESTKSNKGGMKTIQVQHEGIWQAGADQVDPVLYGKIGVNDVPMSMGISGTEGDPAYFFKSTLSSYNPASGAVGELVRFSVSGQSSKSNLVKGTIMLNATKTATGNGTASQLGAVSASQKLYASIHVVAASGTSPTLDVIIESDDNSGITSGITRITFGQFTDIGSEYATPVAGAITDDYWRIGYTIGGTDPSFTFVVIVGIQ